MYFYGISRALLVLLVHALGYFREPFWLFAARSLLVGLLVREFEEGGDCEVEGSEEGFENVR